MNLLCHKTTDNRISDPEWSPLFLCQVLVSSSSCSGLLPAPPPVSAFLHSVRSPRPDLPLLDLQSRPRPRHHQPRPGGCAGRYPGFALIGRELHSEALPALLCHKEPAYGIRPMRGEPGYISVQVSLLYSTLLPAGLFLLSSTYLVRKYFNNIRKIF